MRDTELREGHHFAIYNHLGLERKSTSVKTTISFTPSWFKCQREKAVIGSLYDVKKTGEFMCAIKRVRNGLWYQRFIEYVLWLETRPSIEDIAWSMWKALDMKKAFGSRLMAEIAANTLSQALEELGYDGRQPWVFRKVKP